MPSERRIRKKGKKKKAKKCGKNAHGRNWEFKIRRRHFAKGQLNTWAIWFQTLSRPLRDPYAVRWIRQPSTTAQETKRSRNQQMARDRESRRRLKQRYGERMGRWPNATKKQTRQNPNEAQDGKEEEESETCDILPQIGNKKEAGKATIFSLFSLPTHMAIDLWQTTNCRIFRARRNLTNENGKMMGIPEQSETGKDFGLSW